MSRRLRVAHVYKDVYPPVVGGIEKHIDLLRRGMPDVESSVVVCSRASRGSIRTSPYGLDVRVAELGPRWLGVPASPGFPWKLRQLEADVLHVHMPNPLGELSGLLAAARRPVVVSYHCDVVRQARFLPIYRPLATACLRRASAVIAGSRRLVESSPILGATDREVDIVPYGVDVAALDPGQVGAAERESLRGRYGSPLVLAVGRLVYYKGIEVLIEAARRLSASVVIVGAGPLEQRLRDQARGVPNVHLVGEVGERDLAGYLAAADCFVLPSTSRAESFGVATLEAQAMGVPAVVTDVGTGTVEAISDGETGLVVPPRDPPALAAAIEEVIGDPARATRMGRAARERAVERHSLAQMAAGVRRIYERVAGSGTS